MFALHFDECMEFQQEASLAGGRDVLGCSEMEQHFRWRRWPEAGKVWDVFKKEDIHQEATYGESTVSWLLIFKFGDLEVHLFLT